MSHYSSLYGVLCTIATAALLVGCSQEDSGIGNSPEGQLQIAVAPLGLTGIVNVNYTLTVSSGGEQMWSTTVDSRMYGDDAGSLLYVGSCDASLATNTVSLTLNYVESASGQIDPETYVNPTADGPLSQDADCNENSDTLVSFNITMARDAQQGFFDVAVQFDDIFCSAKLDCGATTARSDDLELLFNTDSEGNSARDMTVVLGFACTGGTGADTHLYMDNLTIDCGTGQGETIVDVSGHGLVNLGDAPNANPDGILFAASVFRGVENVASRAYWNVALGLDETQLPATECTLSATATASDGLFDNSDGFMSPRNTVYPVAKWDVALTDAGSRICVEHQINGEPKGVSTSYTSFTSEVFDHYYVRDTDTVHSNPVTTAPRFTTDTELHIVGAMTRTNGLADGTGISDYSFQYVGSTCQGTGTCVGNGTLSRTFSQ